MSITNFHTVTSSEHFKELLSVDLERVSLISFWAPWAEPCEKMNQVVAELANRHPELLVLQVEAEDQEEISESFGITSVPSFILLRGHELLRRIVGADAEGLTQEVAKRLDKGAQSQPNSEPPKHEPPEELEARMRGIMGQSHVVLFMKGEPANPRCGFSRKAVNLLRGQNVTFTHFDILEDEAVRQGLKKLNDWPTYPQFIVDGEFVGGLDVVTEMVSNEEFAGVFGAA